MRTFLKAAIFTGGMVSAMSATAQNFQDPGEYMGAITQQQENIAKKFMSYASASAHGKRAKKVDNLRTKLLDEVQDSKMNISGMPSFKGDKSYRDTAVNFMKLYFNVLNEDYSKIINMEEIAEQSYDGMEAYLLAQEMVDKKLAEGNDRMQLVSSAFAAKNNITLIKDESALGNMTKTVGALNKYYHEVYLIFFKASVQEDNVLAAAAKGNITGIEQGKSSLLKYAKEGLEKLKTIKGFEADNSLVAATRNMLAFYEREASGKLGAISDYFLTKERFEAGKKAFEKKSDPTKADSDAYNKMVNEINKASQVYNNTGNSLNKERGEALNEWNNAVKTFFDEHTPHYK